MRVGNMGTLWAAVVVFAAFGAGVAQASDTLAGLAPPAALQDGAGTAGVSSISGRATVTSGGATTNLNAASKLKAGDVLNVAAGSRVTLSFNDGSSISLLGPAELEMLQIDDTGRRVKLHSGTVSEAAVQGVALEIQTPYDGSLVLQNATGVARVEPGDRVAFQKVDGDLAQVFHKGALQDLQGGWTLNVRSGAMEAAAAAAAPAAPAAPAKVEFLRIGDRVIAYSPADDFTLTQNGGGGVTLTYNGPDWGVVQVGANSAMYLANGESITFDANGYVTAFTGVYHVYHPLGELVPYDEPVENAADASVSGPGRR